MSTKVFVFVQRSCSTEARGATRAWIPAPVYTNREGRAFRMVEASTGVAREGRVEALQELLMTPDDDYERLMAPVADRMMRTGQAVESPGRAPGSDRT